MLRYLYVDLNSFFASCEQQERLELRGKPVIVVPLMSDSTCAIAASYQAKAYGIKTGTNVGEAKRLCPELVMVQARPKLYVQYHHRIIRAVESCLPVERVLSIDEMCCRLTGAQRTPAEAHALGRAVKFAITAQVGECLTSSVGLAPNVFLAKLASNMQKPDGLVTIHQHELPTRLHGLRLRDFSGIGPRMERRLHRHGIFTAEQLCALPLNRMRTVWGGVGGAKFCLQLQGHDIPFTEAQTRSMSHQHVLEPRLRTREGGLEVCMRLLIKGAERMRSEGYFCRRLSVDVKLAQTAGYFENNIEFQETQDTGFLLARLRELWRNFPLHAPWRVGIALGRLVPGTEHQPDLFDTPRRPGLMRAIDTLNQRFGRGTVGFGGGATTSKKIDGDKIAFQRVPKEYEAL